MACEKWYRASWHNFSRIPFIKSSWNVREIICLHACVRIVGPVSATIPYIRLCLRLCANKSAYAYFVYTKGRQMRLIRTQPHAVYWWSMLTVRERNHHFQSCAGQKRLRISFIHFRWVYLNNIFRFEFSNWIKVYQYISFIHGHYYPFRYSLSIIVQDTSLVASDGIRFLHAHHTHIYM